MAINPYALCPCGSGKKIKFCCGDLAGEMEKVLRMVEGDQPAAAVRHLELLLKKHPRRASLLDLKSNIEMQLGWRDQARTTVNEYLAAEPESFQAWARRAMLCGFSDNLEEGVAALQKAISLCDDPPYTSVVLMAIRLLGRAFAADDQIVPAIAHFLLYGDVSPTGDMDGEKELIRLTREEPIPELLKGPFKLYPSANGATQKDEFAQAYAAAERGAWRTAVESFESLLAEAAGDPRLLYNTALLHGFLGEQAVMVERLREYAASDVAEEDAIEALALAQYLDADDDDLLDAKELVFDLDDLERVMERRQSDRRTPRRPRPDDSRTREENGPPPQAAYYVLDREDPPDWSEISLEDVPRLLATVELFGRETDRPPRAVVRITQDAEYESKLAAVRDLFDLGDGAPASEAETVKLTALGNFTLHYAYVPAEASFQVRLRTFEQSRLKAILDVWPASPQSALGGRAPAELVGDASRRRELQAAALRAEETQVPRRLREKAREIWQRLELEPLSTGVDPTGMDWERLWFIRVRRLDASKLSDERLAKITLDAALANATRAIAHLAPELLRRPQLHRTVNMYAVGGAAVGEAPDYAAAAAFLNDARQLVASDVVPPGLWDVMEFEVALDCFEEERSAELFQRAADRARRDEVIAKAFVRVLAERGLITENGMLRVPPSAPKQPTPPAVGTDKGSEEPRIWTPQSEAAGRQGKGKIWLPS